MITPKLLERLPHQTLVNRATLARFMSKAAGDFRDRGAAVAIFPNHGRRSVQAVRLMSLLVIDQQFICELAHDQFCFACLWKILHLLHSFKVWTTAKCDSVNQGYRVHHCCACRGQASCLPFLSSAL